MACVCIPFIISHLSGSHFSTDIKRENNHQQLALVIENGLTRGFSRAKH